MADLRELYQEVILDHSRNPRNFRKLDPADRHADGTNPLCGDRITLYLKLDGGTIAAVGFQGQGCAISKSSASMMTDAVKGKTEDEARALFESFHDMVTGTGKPDAKVLGKLTVFAGVSEFPARVKCASLAWHTMKAALDQSDKVTME
ncbi:MAG TPA: SUF system NifU family Fe-S cluster assembly protein [Thermoplasmata archaeon]|nr:SUF system NifU family Fe-S cluster assembly protein [Thermoplasmata archaeon]